MTRMNNIRQRGRDFLLFFSFGASILVQGDYVDDSYCGNNKNSKEETLPGQVKCGRSYQSPWAALQDANAEFIDYNEEGEKVLENGEAYRARDFFRTAIVQDPSKPHVWENLAKSAHIYCKEVLQTGVYMKENGIHPEEECLHALREAIAACDVVVLLGNDAGTDLKEELVETFELYYPYDCVSENCEEYERLMTALELESRRRHVNAVNTACPSERSLHVKFSKWEKSFGLVSGETMRKILILMRICGLVLLEKVLDTVAIQEIHADVQKEFQRLLTHLNDKNIDLNATWYESNASSRGGKRFETKFPLRQPYMSPGFFASPFVIWTVKTQLELRVELDTFSAVTSLPGSDNQTWHRDVPEILESPYSSNSTFGPGGAIYSKPHALVVVTPLHKFSREAGFTQFYLGSHVSMSEDDFAPSDLGPGQLPKTPRLALPISFGSAVLFDVRLIHRGIENNSTSNRAISYMSFVQEWWSDTVNFKSQQTRNFDELPVIGLKKLFRRLDHQKYISDLEKLIREHGLQDKLYELQAESEYVPSNLHI
eukprot:m.76867 g.76867  ORF g.76867 m.76867 type:complete len:542 (+) comp12587_c0_seq3:68-1693(+)